jgi:hypothetical protein
MHAHTHIHTQIHESCFEIQTSNPMLIKNGQTQNVDDCILINVTVVLIEIPWFTVQEEEMIESSLKFVTY